MAIHRSRQFGSPHNVNVMTMYICRTSSQGTHSMNTVFYCFKLRNKILWVGLQFVIVVFPDHTYLPFLYLIN